MRPRRSVDAQGRRTHRHRGSHRPHRNLPAVHHPLFRIRGPMKIWGALSAAFTGWMKILRGDASWQQHFAITPAGLATALVIFVFFALVSIAIAAIGINAPTLPGLAAGLVVQCLSIL